MKKLIIAVLGLGLAGTLSADSAYSFTYQAALRDEKGEPIKKNGEVVRNHTVTLRLWDSATGGALLWGRVFNVYTDAEGLFNLEVSDDGGALPTGSPLYAALEKVFLAKDAGGVFVGVEVKDSAGEIVPRQRLFSVPFAAVANDVRKISGDVTVGGDIRMGGGGVTVTESGITQKSGSSTFKDLKLNGTLAAGGKITASNGLVVNGGKLEVKVDLELGSDRKIKIGDSELIPVPVRGIIMWTDAALPDEEHWAVCDGSNGTPDLRGRFIVGVGKVDGKTGTDYAAGAKGGAESVTLTTKQMPAHRHKYLSDDSLSGKSEAYAHQTSSGNEWSFDFDSDGKTKGRTYEGESVGGGQSHENRPPFYALYYIMRIK